MAAHFHAEAVLLGNKAKDFPVAFHLNARKTLPLIYSNRWQRGAIVTVKFNTQGILLLFTVTTAAKKTS